MRYVLLVLLGCMLATSAEANPCWCWDGEKAPFSVAYYVGEWNGQTCVGAKLHSMVKYKGKQFFAELALLVNSREFHEAGSAACPVPTSAISMPEVASR
jgi:hypothetical protein